ncbi:MAG: hypothetical protein ACMUIG_07230 [Thermoplasmatota archaeon]
MMMSSSSDDKQISRTPPSYSFGNIRKAIGRNGILKAMDDEEMGPHVHLTYLLITFLVVSVGIILISFFVL